MAQSCFAQSDIVRDNSRRCSSLSWAKTDLHYYQQPCKTFRYSSVGICISPLALIITVHFKQSISHPQKCHALQWLGPKNKGQLQERRRRIHFRRGGKKERKKNSFRWHYLKVFSLQVLQSSSACSSLTPPSGVIWTENFWCQLFKLINNLTKSERYLK